MNDYQLGLAGQFFFLVYTAFGQLVAADKAGALVTLQALYDFVASVPEAGPGE